MHSGGGSAVADDDNDVLDLLGQPIPQLPIQQILPQSDTVPETDLVQAAKYLQNTLAHRASEVRSDSARQHHMSESVWQTNLSAAAENAARGQEQLWGQVADYFKSLGSSFIPVACLEHVLYDETEITARVTHNEVEGGDREVAKVYVAQTAWCVILQRKLEPSERPQPADFICLRGALSPALRAGAGTSTAAILDVLKTLWVPAPGQTQPFKYHCRLVETDSLAGLILAEKIFSDDRPSVGLLHIRCIAHRVHKSAERVWEFFPELLTGITRACLVLTGPTAMARLRKACKHVITADHLRIFAGRPVLSDTARQFRESVWEHFAPPMQQPRRRALLRSILDNLLNGDLRNPAIEHFCFGNCCQNGAETLAKMKRYLPKILGVLRPGVFCRRDWKDWRSSLKLFGMGLGCHNILRRSFEVAFSQDASMQLEEADLGNVGPPRQEQAPGLEGAVVNPSAAVGGEEGHAARLREERVLNVRVALQMLQKDSTLPDLTMMLTALEPQQQLMGKILFSTSQSWELEQLDSMHRVGARQYRVKNFLEQTDLKDMMQKSMAQLVSGSLWGNYNETELFRSTLLMVSMRSPAVVYETVSRVTSKYPFKVFGLLDNASDEVAEAIFLEKKCLLDPFTLGLIAKASSFRDLQSEQLQQLLKGLAVMMFGTTFSVERLHAQNARRARHRVHTHKPEIEHLALTHMGLATADFLEPSFKANSAQHRGPGRPRTKERKRKTPHTSTVNDAVDEVDANPRKKQRAGAGGPWRFFIHERLAGEAFTASVIKKLSDEYWQLSPEEWERCQRLGSEGSS